MAEFFVPDIGNITATAILGWYAWHSHWQPGSWRDLPDDAVVVELATPGCFSGGEAMAYIEGHNRAAIERRDHRWAVAVPVVIQYQGDCRPGERIAPRRLAAASWRRCNLPSSHR